MAIQKKKPTQRRTNLPPWIISSSKIRNWYHRDHVTHSTSVPPPSFFPLQNCHVLSVLFYSQKAAMLFVESVLDRPHPLKMRDIASAGA